MSPPGTSELFGQGAGLPISQGMGQVAFRRAADRLEATAARSGYRRRRQLTIPPGADVLVPAAAARAREGDDDALRLLFLLYADNVYGYVLAIVRYEHDAEDITSELFARLPRALRRYEASGSPFATWLLRVARNAALDHLRARRSVPRAEVRSVTEAAEPSARERLADLRAAFAALPADQRQVMLLRLIAGMSPAEVALELGRSVDAVHALQHRARRRLRQELTQQGWAPSQAA
jgi:RNA polymerase sigma-70 factor (ECF subfamily)